MKAQSKQADMAAAIAKATMDEITSQADKAQKGRAYPHLLLSENQYAAVLDAMVKVTMRNIRALYACPYGTRAEDAVRDNRKMLIEKIEPVFKKTKRLVEMRELDAVIQTNHTAITSKMPAWNQGVMGAADARDYVLNKHLFSAKSRLGVPTSMILDGAEALLREEKSLTSTREAVASLVAKVMHMEAMSK